MIPRATSTYWMPPEWHHQEATFFTWPHNASIWRGLHQECEIAFARIIANLSTVQPVIVNVPDAGWEQRALNAIARENGVLEQITILHIESNDVWCRDHGPTVVFESGGQPQGDGAPRRMFLDWIFNAWGGKYPADHDDQIARTMARKLNFPTLRVPLVLEGGAIETNGDGDLLTTESVLKNPNRNPELTQADLEAQLCKFLGVSRIHWLGDGLTGDDTDGHIDDLTRFCDARTLVTVLPENTDHHDYNALHDNYRRLQTATPARGGHFTIHTLPMPEPVRYQGEILPASYANFLIANDMVLVPTFGQANDDRALGILQELFVGRRVIGIDSRALVSQYGAIHCISQQLPAAHDRHV